MSKKQAASPKTKSAPRAATSKAKKAVHPPASENQSAKKKSPGAAPARPLSSELIGESAGEVWRVLAERGPQSLASLKKASDAPGDLVVLAVGWLAREEKLAFETNGRTAIISLR